MYYSSKSERLTVMARTVVLADQCADPRALTLYMVMSALTGLDPNKIRARIQEMAHA